MSMLALIKRFAEEINVNTPTQVMGTIDPQIKQMKALLQKEIDDLAGRGDWQELTNEALHTTIDVSGTTTTSASFWLLDSTATFLSDNITIGESVTNNDTGATSTVLSVVNDTSVALNDEIFAAALSGESYTIGLENQGAIKDIASNGFRYVKNGTIWDRDLRLPVYIIDGTDWQQVKAIAVTGPRYQARIRGGDLISNPVPTAGHTWAFEYITWNAITDSTGTTNKQYFTADSDLMLLPEPIIEAGLQWRWKKAKGFEYAEDFRSYEVMVANGLSRNGMRRVLDMGMRQYTPNPKIHVTDGNWNV